MLETARVRIDKHLVCTSRDTRRKAKKKQQQYGISFDKRQIERLVYLNRKLAFIFLCLAPLNPIYTN